jgi:hypothetical protein
MARKSNELFKRATAEIYALGDEITRRKSAEAEGSSLTAEMRASSAMLRVGLECHGKEARTLSHTMLTRVVNAAQRPNQGAGRSGLELRAEADKMVQALLDAESATR